MCHFPSRCFRPFPIPSHSSKMKALGSCFSPLSLSTLGVSFISSYPPTNSCCFFIFLPILTPPCPSQASSSFILLGMCFPFSNRSSSLWLLATFRWYDILLGGLLRSQVMVVYASQVLGIPQMAEDVSQSPQAKL